MIDDDSPKRSGAYTNRQLAGMLRPFFRPYAGHFIGAFCLLIIASLLQVAGPPLVKRAIDVDIAGGDMPGLLLTVVIFFAVQIAYLVVLYVLRNWLEWAGQAMMALLRRSMFEHLLALPLAFHDRYTPGRLLSRVESDTQALRMLFTTTVVMLLGDVFLFAGMFVVMLIVSPRLTVVTAVLLPALIGLTVYYQRRLHPVFVEVRRRNAAIAGRLTEFLQAMPILQAFNRRRWALADLMQLGREKFEVQYPGERDIMLWFNGVFLLRAFAILAIIAFGGYWAMAGIVTIGTLVMFIGYVRRFFEPILRLSEQLATIQKAFAAAERTFLLLNEPIAIQDREHPRKWPSLNGQPRSDGRTAVPTVRFDHVWFRYAEEGDWVLKDVSFTLPAGEHWALVGATGSGKTTIVNLLLRFYEPQRGAILIDGVDLRDLRQRDLRNHIGLVLQDIFLFPGDLMKNLTLGTDASAEQVESAARLTLADRFIRDLPGGYHADLAERGGNLSVGQRQLLSFTRALLRDPELLILDEATSAVDPATEALLSESTERMLKGRTALVIAHRLSTIRHADRVLVMHHGELAEQGTHEELIDRQGLYHALHELQFATEQPGR